MAKKHEVRQGETLLQLAYEGGFDSWKTVWKHEANAELRELRKDPQTLLPGDEVVIPRKKVEPRESCPVDKVHRFRLTRPRAWLNLRMLDESGEPIVGARYELTVEGEVHEGKTDADGELSVEVCPNAHEGNLVLWPDEAAPAFEAPVHIGHLDPASAQSGMLARLMNLGWDWNSDSHDQTGGPSAVPWEDLRYVLGGRDAAVALIERVRLLGDDGPGIMMRA